MAPIGRLCTEHIPCVLRPTMLFHLIDLPPLTDLPVFFVIRRSFVPFLCDLYRGCFYIHVNTNGSCYPWVSLCRVCYALPSLFCTSCFSAYNGWLLAYIVPLSSTRVNKKATKPSHIATFTDTSSVHLLHSSVLLWVFVPSIVYTQLWVWMSGARYWMVVVESYKNIFNIRIYPKILPQSLFCDDEFVGNRN